MRFILLSSSDLFLYWTIFTFCKFKSRAVIVCDSASKTAMRVHSFFFSRHFWATFSYWCRQRHKNCSGVNLPNWLMIYVTLTTRPSTRRHCEVRDQLIRYRSSSGVVSGTTVRALAVASPGFGARGAQVEAPKAPWGVGVQPSPEKFLNFYIKMVSSGAFWVATSYSLAACFTGIGSTCGVEIYWRWRSFYWTETIVKRLNFHDCFGWFRT